MNAYNVRVEGADLTPVRERIERVPGFIVQDDDTVLVEASSAEVAAAWPVARLEAP